MKNKMWVTMITYNNKSNVNLGVFFGFFVVVLFVCFVLFSLSLSHFLFFLLLAAHYMNLHFGTGRKYSLSCKVRRNLLRQSTCTNLCRLDALWACEEWRVTYFWWGLHVPNVVSARACACAFFFSVFLSSFFSSFFLSVDCFACVDVQVDWLSDLLGGGGGGIVICALTVWWLARWRDGWWCEFVFVILS